MSRLGWTLDLSTFQWKSVNPQNIYQLTWGEDHKYMFVSKTGKLKTGSFINLTKWIIRCIYFKKYSLYRIFLFVGNPFFILLSLAILLARDVNKFFCVCVSKVLLASNYKTDMGVQRKLARNVSREQDGGVRGLQRCHLSGHVPEWNVKEYVWPLCYYENLSQKDSSTFKWDL